MADDDMLKRAGNLLGWDWRNIPVSREELCAALEQELLERGLYRTQYHTQDRTSTCWWGDNRQPQQISLVSNFQEAESELGAAVQAAEWFKDKGKWDD